MFKSLTQVKRFYIVPNPHWKQKICKNYRFYYYFQSWNTDFADNTTVRINNIINQPCIFQDIQLNFVGNMVVCSNLFINLFELKANTFTPLLSIYMAVHDRITCVTRHVIYLSPKARKDYSYRDGVLHEYRASWTIDISSS